MAEKNAAVDRINDKKPLNWVNISTLVAVAILVGTEFVGASWAAGWALAGYNHLSPTFAHIFEAVFGLIGVVALFFFMRVAVRHEQIRK